MNKKEVKRAIEILDLIIFRNKLARDIGRNISEREKIKNHIEEIEKIFEYTKEKLKEELEAERKHQNLDLMEKSCRQPNDFNYNDSLGIGK